MLVEVLNKIYLTCQIQLKKKKTDNFQYFNTYVIHILQIVLYIISI